LHQHQSTPVNRPRLTAQYRFIFRSNHRYSSQEADMHPPLYKIALGLLAFSLPGALACSCSHNNDAGRWNDGNSPAGAVAILVSKGGGTYDAKGQGHMSLTFSKINEGIKGCISSTAANWQSYHGDWFLYTVIHCEDSGDVADLSIW
jgi:hypothetical protein